MIFIQLSFIFNCTLSYSILDNIIKHALDDIEIIVSKILTIVYIWSPKYLERAQTLPGPSSIVLI